ncbi:hypothetical protein ACPOL_5158 [Acidisarcina polymorpha]|uniref:Uncharacterized protein n=1 Tax=Acidisarcina polymorpha TaxID=2211140 RepID=A0A2Z5G5E3_9BACT|nr:hypothetical protein ACPOL_5158 [Acidisarcina polymorpha]
MRSMTSWTQEISRPSLLPPDTTIALRPVEIALGSRFNPQSFISDLLPHGYSSLDPSMIGGPDWVARQGRLLEEA